MRGSELVIKPPAGSSTAEGARWHACPVSMTDPQVIARMLPTPMLPLSCRNPNHASRSHHLCGSTCTMPPPASCGAPTPMGPPLCPGLQTITHVSNGLCCVRVSFGRVMCRHGVVAALLGWLWRACIHASHDASRCPPAHARNLPFDAICIHLQTWLAGCWTSTLPPETLRTCRSAGVGFHRSLVW